MGGERGSSASGYEDTMDAERRWSNTSHSSASINSMPVSAGNANNIALMNMTGGRNSAPHDSGHMAGLACGANASSPFIGGHLPHSAKGHMAGIPGAAVAGGNINTFHNPPTPGNFLGNNNMGLMGNELDNPLGSPLGNPLGMNKNSSNPFENRLLNLNNNLNAINPNATGINNHAHQPFSNYESIMSSLGHFNTNLSYGQATQRMNPFYEEREKEIHQRFSRNERQDGGKASGHGFEENHTGEGGLEQFDLYPRPEQQQGDLSQWGMAQNLGREVINNHYDDSYHQHDADEYDGSFKQQQQPDRIQQQKMQQSQETKSESLFSRRTIPLKEWMACYKPQPNHLSCTSVNASHKYPERASPIPSSIQNDSLPQLRKAYIEQCTEVAHIVVTKIIAALERKEFRAKNQLQNQLHPLTDPTEGLDLNEEWEPRPSDICVERITVTESRSIIGDGSGAAVKPIVEGVNFNVLTDFNWEDSSSWIDDAKKSESSALLHAIGKFFYELFMGGEEVPGSVLDDYNNGGTGNTKKRERTQSGGSVCSNDGIFQMLKLLADGNNADEDSCDGNEHEDEDEALLKMRNAGLPEPLCGFISDIFRVSSATKKRPQDNITLSDLISDLEQMIALPEVFLHASITSRWELLFGNHHLFGRQMELNVLTDAAARIEEADSQKEAILVSGHAGSGETHNFALTLDCFNT